jgi:microcin C transport system substrate-binding protein
MTRSAIMRSFTAGLAAAGLAALTMAPGWAQDAENRHGLSLLGDVKYPPDFEHFDYVYADAPKGGELRISAIGTFDSLNGFIIKGNSAGLLGYIYDTLMQSAQDEPSTEYGLIAESVSHPADFSSVTYTLRPQARWHDGQPVTPEDVIFSLDTLKEAHPRYAYYYANVVKAEKVGDHQVKFTFSQTGNRELPQITGQLPVLPRHYWEGTDANGRKRDVFATTLEPPLGSGPYKIGKVETGRTIAVERVPDYWGKDLPVNVGRYNFDRITAEYYRDGTVALEAFKSGRFDVRLENSAKNWATAYDFPALTRGDVIKEVFTDENAEAMQAFVFNTRRARFADPRVRRALNYAFDFESSNRLLFFDQYLRVDSYFANSELAATDLPTGKELEILETVRGEVPPEVFTQVYTNPVGGDPAAARKNLRTAVGLLEEAGWSIKGGRLVNRETGETMTAEFLLVSPDFERIVLPYIQNLKRLGIAATVRTIDTSQYQNRTDSFDFDVVVGGWQQSLSPGNEQRDYWGSASADRPGSRNLVGIKNPAVDKLIDRIIYAEDREELVAASRALDRVLLWNHYVVPQWYFKGTRIARWNRFGIPRPGPDYGIGYPDTWWYDAELASKIRGAK